MSAGARWRDTLNNKNNRGNGGKDFCVYILASQRNGTLYIGVTSDLNSRNGSASGSWM
jgi:predicted GIY-YIG superfamily endonuclease